MTTEPAFTLSDDEVRQFKPTARYAVMTAAGLLVGLLLLWQLLAPLRSGLSLSAQDLLTGEGLFAVAALATAVYSARQAATRVTLTSRTLTCTAPLGPARTVELRQLMSVSESGRAGNALIVLYHPRQATGLLDLDDVRSLALPALEQQDALRTFLEKQVPT